MGRRVNASAFVPSGESHCPTSNCDCGPYRDGYADNNPALVRTLEELIRLGIRPLKLGGLSKDAIAQMLSGLSERQPPESLVSLIFEESQGNPFFVEELYRHLLEDGKVFDAAGQFRTDVTIDETDVPENVRLIIGRRLERLQIHGSRRRGSPQILPRSRNGHRRRPRPQSPLAESRSGARPFLRIPGGERIRSWGLTPDLP